MWKAKIDSIGGRLFSKTARRSLMRAGSPLDVPESVLTYTATKKSRILEDAMITAQRKLDVLHVYCKPEVTRLDGARHRNPR